MRRHTLAIAISALLLGTAATQAQPAQPSTEASRATPASPPANTSAVTDKDMKMRDQWTQADKDRNGSLSLLEMQASMPNAAANFSQMDANGDGQVSNGELRSYKVAHEDRKWRQSFESADANRDGALTLSEAQGGLPAIAAQFTAIDSNGDNKLSLDEMQAHRKAQRPSGDSSMEADQPARTPPPAATDSKPDATSPNQ